MSTTTRKLCRSGQRCTPQNLKEALDCLGHHSDLTVEELAEGMPHKTAGTLGKQLSKYDEDNYPTLRDIVPLTLLSKNDVVIDHLCRSVKGVFVRVDGSSGHGVDAEHLGNALREFADVLQCHASANADGIVTADEADTLDREVDEACAELAALKIRFRSRVQAATTIVWPDRKLA